MGFVLLSQSPGSANAIRFDGTGGLALRAAFDTMQLPITVTAWVNTATKSTPLPIFSSCTNSTGYMGVFVQIKDIWMESNVGVSAGFASRDRRTKVATLPTQFGNWKHVAFVINAENDMVNYLNGIDMGGSFNTSTGFYRIRNGCSAHIGQTMGGGGPIYYSGDIDEVTVWNRSLSLAEVRTVMSKKLRGTEQGLIGNYALDEGSGSVSVDKTTRGFDALKSSGTSWITSQAAIGDTNYFLYSTSPTVTNFTQTLSNGYTIEVYDISPPTAGVQVYEVLETPNTLSGITSTIPVNHYFGVYIARTNLNIDVTYKVRVLSQNTVIDIFSRKHNASNSWQTRTSVLAGANLELTQQDVNRQEYIINARGCPVLQVNLGADIQGCAIPSNLNLSVLNPNPNYSYSWSSGEVGTSILVNDTGVFVLTADSAGCSGTDTIVVTALGKTVFNYIPAITFCDDELAILELFKPGFSFGWPDGSISNKYIVKEPQVVNYKVYGPCDTLEKTILVEFEDCNCDVFIPNVFTPNGDGLNETFEIKASCTIENYYLLVYTRWGQLIYQSNTITEPWDGSIKNKKATEGVYFFKLNYGESNKTKTEYGFFSLIR